MCCFITALLLFGPRLATVVWYLIEPARFNLAFNTLVIPCLGFIFLPWTLLSYLLVWQPAAGVVGFGWIIVGLGLLADIATYRAAATAIATAFRVTSSRKRRFAAALKRRCATFSFTVVMRYSKSGAPTFFRRRAHDPSDKSTPASTTAAGPGLVAHRARQHRADQHVGRSAGRSLRTQPATAGRGAGKQPEDRCFTARLRRMGNGARPPEFADEK